MNTGFAHPPRVVRVRKRLKDVFQGMPGGIEEISG
jgi:hypothetical protein